MEEAKRHDDYLVNILDSTGKIIGQKKRAEIDKLHDIYHGVFIFLITPLGELIITKIPSRKDLPNLYAGKFGVPVATIRRSHETSLDAAKRALKRELYIDATPTFIGEGMRTFPDGSTTYATSYYLVVEDVPEKFSAVDIGAPKATSAHELIKDLVLHPDRYAPTLKEAWLEWHARLPV